MRDGAEKRKEYLRKICGRILDEDNSRLAPLALEALKECGLVKEALFTRFVLYLWEGDARELSARGDRDNAARKIALAPLYRAQFRTIDPLAIREELLETGGWQVHELQDNWENQKRILWIAGCNLKEENRWA